MLGFGLAAGGYQEGAPNQMHKPVLNIHVLIKIKETQRSDII